MQEPVLESLLNDITVIRMSFDTKERFPADDPMQQELLAMAASARRKLIWKLRKEADLPHQALAINVRGFKFALRLILTGVSRRKLDEALKLDIFSAVAAEEAETAGEEPIYIYEFDPQSALFDSWLVPAAEIYALFLADIRRSAEDWNNYSSKHLFDRNVFQKYAALIFALYAGSIGTGGLSDDGDNTVSPVPRRPVTPQRSAGATNPIPKTFDQEP